MITYSDIKILPFNEREHYIGFQLGYFHSKNMGIKRVNTNNRYQEQIVPNFELKTNQNNKNGTYLYKQEIKDKQIRIDFAFDSLTFEQLTNMQNWLSNNEIQPLILDEYPANTYIYVKIQNPPNITYLCFEEEKNDIIQRIYKGEGTINLIQYSFKEN